MTLDSKVLGDALDALKARGKQIDTLDNLAAGARDALALADTTLTHEGVAAFLATCLMESAHLRTSQEYRAKAGTKARKNQERYEPYIGRGFVQVTWEKNYAEFGKWAHSRRLVDSPDVFVKKPERLAEKEWRWLTGVWFFNANRLWPLANRGDFRAVSNGVNRGNPRAKADPYGWAERQAYYEALVKMHDLHGGGPASPAPTQSKPDRKTPPPHAQGKKPPAAASNAPGMLQRGSRSAAVAILQRGMAAAFPAYALNLVADGHFGPHTEAVVREFQRRSGVAVDGKVGPETKAALRRSGVIF